MGIALIGSIGGRFLNLGETVQSISTIAISCLIGILYFCFSWAMESKIIKVAFLISGVLIILQAFVFTSGVSLIILIASFFIPLFLASLFMKEDKEKLFTE